MQGHLASTITAQTFQGSISHAQGLEECGLRQVPQTAALSRLTLLNLRANKITSLAPLTPVAAHLEILDLSSNRLGSSMAYLAPANLAALGEFRCKSRLMFSNAKFTLLLHGISLQPCCSLSDDQQ